jgi:hypothetical protein
MQKTHTAMYTFCFNIFVIETYNSYNFHREMTVWRILYTVTSKYKQTKSVRLTAWLYRGMTVSIAFLLFLLQACLSLHNLLLHCSGISLSNISWKEAIWITESTILQIIFMGKLMYYILLHEIGMAGCCSIINKSFFIALIIILLTIKTILK